MMMMMMIDDDDVKFPLVTGSVTTGIPGKKACEVGRKILKDCQKRKRLCLALMSTTCQVSKIVLLSFRKMN